MGALQAMVANGTATDSQALTTIIHRLAQLVIAQNGQQSTGEGKLDAGLRQAEATILAEQARLRDSLGTGQSSMDALVEDFRKVMKLDADKAAMARNEQLKKQMEDISGVGHSLHFPLLFTHTLSGSAGHGLCQGRGFG